MRKQDRIANQKQDRPEQEKQTQRQPQPRDREQMRGSASDAPQRPPRQAGKLPLPD